MNELKFNAQDGAVKSDENRYGVAVAYLNPFIISKAKANYFWLT